MADIDYDVEAQSAVGGDGFIHGCVKDGNERFDVLALSSGTEPDPGAISLRRDLLLERIDTQVHPWAIESFLDH